MTDPFMLDAHLRALMRSEPTDNYPTLDDERLAYVIAALAEDLNVVEYQIDRHDSGAHPRGESWRSAAQATRVRRDANLRLARAEWDRRHYAKWRAAFDYFNKELFGGRLPQCGVAVQSEWNGKRHSGYYCRFQYGDEDSGEEIVVKSKYFWERPTEKSLAELVHDMCQCEQYHFGTKGGSGYHNKEWGRMMKAVGLYPSDTGEPGGKEIGRHVSHYPIPDGPFARACAEYLAGGTGQPLLESIVAVVSPAEVAA